MYEQVEKPKENKSRAVANSVTQKKSGLKQCFKFVDNRPVQRVMTLNEVGVSAARLATLICKKGSKYEKLYDLATQIIKQEVSDFKSEKELIEEVEGILDMPILHDNYKADLVKAQATGEPHALAGKEAALKQSGDVKRKEGLFGSEQQTAVADHVESDISKITMEFHSHTDERTADDEQGVHIKIQCLTNGKSYTLWKKGGFPLSRCKSMLGVEDSLAQLIIDRVNIMWEGHRNGDAEVKQV